MGGVEELGCLDFLFHRMTAAVIVHALNTCYDKTEHQHNTRTRFATSVIYSQRKRQQSIMHTFGASRMDILDKKRRCSI